MTSSKLEFITALGSPARAAMSLKDPSQPGNYSHRLKSGPRAAANLADFIDECGWSELQVVMPRHWPHLSRVMAINHDTKLVEDPRAGGVIINPELPVGDNPTMPHSCDGLVAQYGHALLIQTADCPPLLMHDPEAGVIAAVHCGWKPVAHWIVPDAIAVMKSLGSHPSDIFAWIGPSGGRDEYEFALDERSRPLLEQTRRVEDFQRHLHPNSFESLSLDVSSLVEEDLRRCGVEAGNITVDYRSTIANRHFHSWRRDRGDDPANPQHGLGSTMIWLEN